MACGRHASLPAQFALGGGTGAAQRIEDLVASP